MKKLAQARYEDLCSKFFSVNSVKAAALFSYIILGLEGGRGDQYESFRNIDLLGFLVDGIEIWQLRRKLNGKYTEKEEWNIIDFGYVVIGLYSSSCAAG